MQTHWKTNWLACFIYSISSIPLIVVFLIGPFFGSVSFAQSPAYSEPWPSATHQYPSSATYGPAGQSAAPPSYSAAGRTTPVGVSQTPFGLRQSTAGAIAGALLGAASGALVGHATDDPGPGAAIGAGFGAVSGYMLGRQLESRETALTSQQQVLKQQQQELARNRALLEELKRRRLEVRETDRGVVVQLPDVLFGFNSARLSEPARSAVDHIAATLRNRAPKRRISIEGHTDAIGNDAYNTALSQRRAQAVAHALQGQGVSHTRLTIHGYGEKYPLAPNRHADGSDNPTGRAKNRRVEVVIENS